MKNILIAEDDKNFGIILQNECRTKNIPLPVRDVVKAVLSFISKSYDSYPDGYWYAAVKRDRRLANHQKNQTATLAILYSGEAEAQATCARSPTTRL